VFIKNGYNIVLCLKILHEIKHIKIIEYLLGRYTITVCHYPIIHLDVYNNVYL